MINEFFKDGFAKVEKKSIVWLLSGEATTQRLKRQAGEYTHVVHVEMSGNRMEEFDAINSRHAKQIMKKWLTNHRALSAAIRVVQADGSLGEPCIYDWSDFSDEGEV